MIERRTKCRRRVLRGANIRHHSLPSLTACLVRSQSDGGLRLCISETIPLPDTFDLLVAGRNEPWRVELVWRQGDAVGLRFAPPALSDVTYRLTERLEASEAENARLKRLLADALRATVMPASQLH